MPIRVLDPILVGKISAGEVVERPSSVVKELVENSIDAGATKLTVEIKDGGIESLRVTDNGSGIEPNQVATAFQNHATSKLSSAEQLDDIRTLGFRGEALPSIAAVARIELQTRTKGGRGGVKYEIDETGRKLSDAGCPEGTTIVARDLFYNTPVRRTFLKKPQYEAGLVTETVARLILANPQVAIKYVNNGRVIYQSFGDGDIRHAAYAVYGREVARQLTDIDVSEGAFRIRGLLGLGELARSSRGQQMFFINGRVVRCAILQKALEAAVEGRVPRGSYPMCALHLTIAPGSVDVNVHPSKLEVRFRDEEAVYNTALALIQNSFGKKSALQDMFEDKIRDVRPVSRITVVRPAPEEQPEQKPEPRPEPKIEIKPAPAPELRPEPKIEIRPEPKPEIQSDSKPEIKPEIKCEIKPEIRPAPQPAIPEQPETQDFFALLHQEKERLGLGREERPQRPAPAVQETMLKAGGKPCRAIGTLFHTYILVETDDAMVMIDQHAAHERLQYEKFKAQLEAGNACQMLAVPLVVDVSPRELAVLSDNLEVLKETGYDAEVFGERSIRVNGVPHLFGRADVRPLFVELADELSNLRSAEIERRKEEVMRFSCRRSVKAGNTLTSMEIQVLIDMLDQAETPPTCPHGRPIFRVFSRREIERMFGRIK